MKWGRRGPQGVQGVQGVEGEFAQGEQGVQGIQGEPGHQGERGRRGAALPHKITASFAIVVAVSFLVLSLLAWQIRVTRNLARENRNSVEFLCNTTTTLDAAVIVPFLTEARLAIKVLPAGEDRARLLRIRSNLEVAHDELSSTSACEEVR